MKTKKLFGKAIASVVALTAACGALFGTAQAAAFADDHVHTFSSEWSHGYKNHWHETTCGHDQYVKDVAPHTFENDTCTVCGAKRMTAPDKNHVHTYNLDVYEHDATYHWHQASCHEVMRDLAVHSFDSAGYCVCGYYNGQGTIDPPDPGPDNPDPPTPPTPPAEIPAEISAAAGYNEGLYAEWSATSISGVTAYYQPTVTSNWTKIDDELIRLNGGKARVDAVGLKAGTYNLKISSNGKDAVVKGITVSAYDRSGYAHFNYSTGVGAYNNDGTLKDDAIVIYVTNENKNTVMTEVVKENPDLTMFQIPGSDWGNKDAAGIGWWLNNAQYTMSNANSDKNKVPSNTYDAVNGKNLSFMQTERPIVVRFLGTVTVPEGCTAYNSEKEGGLVGDNGNMARMRDLKNVTIEGIGNDAKIEGWGFHFMASNTAGGRGESFEVRNLTFDKYTEDAIGMEGVQSGNAITQPVSRCWVHNNVFYPGYCASPAESDKAEGDGSCDFKRGEYFTLSYNYFTECHKTNLVGSSDPSMQFNITMHHNWWNQCGSRIPLLRHANLHFYNNYVSVDPNNKAGGISYVHSLRASCLLFSEANYYDGVKNISDGKSGGASAAWNNIYYACSNTKAELTELSSRTQTVSNSCASSNANYSSFYTNPDQFYYDAEKQVSKCLLDDAATARKRVMMNAGVLDFGKSENELSFVENVPTSPMNLPENGTVTIDLTKVSKGGNSTVDGVLFSNISGVSSGTVKGKGQLASFTLTSDATVTVSASSNSGKGAELMDADGKQFGHVFTSLTVSLPAGTYVIASDLKDKELVISALSFTDEGSSSKNKIAAAEKAISEIPANVTLADADTVAAAEAAYNALTAEEKAGVASASVTKLNNALAKLETLRVADVIAKIEAIGAVDKNSYDKINAARTAYDGLSASAKAQVTNYSVLVQAEQDFKQYAVKNVIDIIEALPDVAAVDTSSSAAIESADAEYKKADAAYSALSASEQAQVTNFAKLTQGKAKLVSLMNVVAFRKELATNDPANVNGVAVTALQEHYNALTPDEKAMLTVAEQQKFEAVVEAYNALLNMSVTSTFIGGVPSSDLFASVGAKQSAKKTAFVVNAYGGELASGIKFESTTEFTLTLSMKMTVKLYMYNANYLSIDGASANVSTENGDNVITVTLEAGTHSIKRGKSENSMYYAVLTPAT